jgi:hypothetical protein
MVDVHLSMGASEFASTAQHETQEIEGPFSLEIDMGPQDTQKLPLIGSIGLGLMISAGLWGLLYAVVRIAAAI